MDSSPSPSEYPTAANAVAVSVLHRPRCSGCRYKREYICPCELMNSDLEVSERDYKFWQYVVSDRIKLQLVGFEVEKSGITLKAGEIYAQLGDRDTWLKIMRVAMLEMKTAPKISRNLYSRNLLYSMDLKISPDFSVRDVGWLNNWNFSIEQTDFGARFQPLFLPIVYAQTPDHFQQYESIIWNRRTFSFFEMFDHVPAPRYSCPKYISYRKYSPVGSGLSSLIEAYRKMSEEYHIDIESLEPMVFERIPETKRFIHLKSLLYTLPVPDPFTKLNEIVLGITGQAAFSLMGYALTGSSSSSPALYFVVGATAIGFICTWIALTLKRTKKHPARILGKVGAMAAACAVIVAMGTVLPEKTIWISGIACLLTGVAMALA